MNSSVIIQPFFTLFFGSSYVLLVISAILQLTINQEYENMRKLPFLWVSRGSIGFVSW